MRRIRPLGWQGGLPPQVLSLLSVAGLWLPIATDKRVKQITFRFGERQTIRDRSIRRRIRLRLRLRRLSTAW